MLVSFQISARFLAAFKILVNFYLCTSVSAQIVPPVYDLSRRVPRVAGKVCLALGVVAEGDVPACYSQFFLVFLVSASIFTP